MKANACDCGTSGFPKHWVFMRHLESESNLMHEIRAQGKPIDPNSREQLERLREKLEKRPDYAQRLSERAEAQAPVVARWINTHLIGAYPELANGFDMCRTSPYVRCKESIG